MKTRLAIAALVTVELACAPFAAEARTHEQFRNHTSTTKSGTFPLSYPTSVLNPPLLSYSTSVLNPPSASYPTSVLNR